MKLRMALAAGVCLGIATTGVFAQVRNAMTPAAFVFNGKQHTITQSATLDTTAVAKFYKRDGECAGVCVSPLQVSPLIETVGEAEVISFITEDVARGAGLLLDSRTQAGRAQGHIAGSINVPVALLAPDNPYLSDILMAMGAAKTADGMNFDTALPLIVFDDGPTSNEATQLIDALRGTGYPDNKIKYYRGGMQVWTTLGLSAEDI